MTLAIPRSKIAETARSYIGVEYRHQGRSRQAIDCIGLVVVVANELGYPIKTATNYSADPAGNFVLKGCDEWLIKTGDKTSDLKEGDILVMWGHTRGEAQHFAFVAMNSNQPTMIHAWSKFEKVVEHGITDFWRKRIMGVYSLPNVIDG